MIIRPQPGPQRAFMSTDVDVALYGGAAGAGKTAGLVFTPLQYVKRVPKFKAVIFRRTYPEITSAGGLWDESAEWYPHAGAEEQRSALRWTWPNGSSVKFGHMQHEKNLHSWQGSQIPLICFDELTHFSLRMFLYMMSRNRSTCGVRPFMRHTTNPDPDSWVREWVDWYLDSDGYPRPERSGVVRWFARHKSDIVWEDDPEKLRLLGLRPKSFTFISAKVDDNKILLDKDPDYLANLESLLPHERERLRYGNWNARAAAGSYFKAPWFEIVDAAPQSFDDEVRYWDRAATEKSVVNPDPDATVGVHMRRKGDTFFVCDVERDWRGPGGVQDLIDDTAKSQPHCTICLEEDPGQAGKSEVWHLVSHLKRFRVEVRRASTSKEVRAKPVATQAKHGNIKLVRGKWNKAFLQELEAFPTKDIHDDQVDALSGAYNYLVGNMSSVSQRKF